MGHDRDSVPQRGGVSDLIRKLLGLPTSRLTIEGTQPTEMFDLTLRASVPMTDSVVSAWILRALHDIFGARLQYRTEQKKGWALSVVHPERLRATAVASGSSVQWTDSSWIGVGVAMPVFVRGLEEHFGEHFFDDTGVEGTFDFEVPMRTFASMRAALEQQYGLTLQETDRPVSIARLSFLRHMR